MAATVLLLSAVCLSGIAGAAHAKRRIRVLLWGSGVVWSASSLLLSLYIKAMRGDIQTEGLGYFAVGVVIGGVVVVGCTLVALLTYHAELNWVAATPIVFGVGLFFVAAAFYVWVLAVGIFLGDWL
jgi:hypothetical protein